MGSLVEKYQEQFNECIRLRDLALHNSLLTRERIDYEKYNAKVLVLIDVIEDFRKLEETISIDSNVPTNNLSTIILNNVEDVPMDEDSFFRT